MTTGNAVITHAKMAGHVRKDGQAVFVVLATLEIIVRVSKRNYSFLCLILLSPAVIHSSDSFQNSFACFCSNFELYRFEGPTMLNSNDYNKDLPPQNNLPKKTLEFISPPLLIVCVYTVKPIEVFFEQPVRSTKLYQRLTFHR
jgi:hypothetical protein